MKKLDVIIPCLNEEKILEQSVTTLRGFLKENMSDYDYSITIADNGSKDATLEIAKRLSEEHPEVGYNRLEQRGRGRALKKSWSESDADIVSYMDVDLSTDLKAFRPMIDAIANDNFHLATGTRLTKDSETKRCFKREFTSRVYNILIKAILNTKYSDAQCGFKAVDKKTFQKLLPHLKDNEWFLDTELMTIAEKTGHNIFEIPVLWIEDMDSRVNVLDTAVKYIRDLIKIRFRLKNIKNELQKTSE
jgi:glycosyltransferase involved in cell wall biosynthesis